MNYRVPPMRPTKLVRILIVEDESIIAINLQEALEDMGYSVVAIASTGGQALEIAKAHRPDIVLMDIFLEGSTDGIKTADYIWENLQIPIIYVTGHSDPATVDRAVQTSPFSYIVKPIKERDLYIAIETTLRRYQREQWLSGVLRCMADGVIVVDIQNRVRYLNPAAERMTGWTLRDALNQDFSFVFKLVNETTGEPVANPMVAALNQGIIVQLDDRTILLSRHGPALSIADSAAPLRDNLGTITGGICVFRDISEQRRAEEHDRAIARARQLEAQITELERLNQLKDDFLSTVSHELRTPLTNINVAANLLEVVLNQNGILDPSLESTAAINRYLKILHSQCYQELNLINDLLDMQRLSADAYEIAADIIELTHWLPNLIKDFEIRAQSNDLRLVAAVLRELPTLVTDHNGLKRVISELLNNACKYTPPGGVISVSAEVLEDDQVQIKICNSGVMISATELERIFEPFYRIPQGDRWRHSGTGLGLSLIKRLVERLNGQIRATSESNQVCFAVTLPIGDSNS
jgi:PAS domain S-box-containing protein